MNQGPVWTPDGSHILFNSNRSGSFGLWSVPVRNGKRAGVPSLLKPETGAIGSIGISPSGKYYYNYQAGLNQVFVAEMDPASARVRGVAASITESFVGTVPAWSRDGKWLAFKRRHSGSNYFDAVIHSMEKAVEWTIVLNVTGDSRPVWYLDGSVQLNGTPLRVSVSGGQPKEITAPIALPPAGVASPDDKLLYRRANGSNEDLEIIEVTTGERKQTLKVPGGVIYGALSPDGKTLSVVGGTNNVFHLSRIAVDGSDYREIYSGVSPGQPTWTRDGRSILFVQQNKNSAVGRMMRIPAQGGQPEFAGISAEGLKDLELSPDGSKIAYSTRSHNDEVWALDNVLSALK
jgi:Tol biopolymer transport system component